MLSDEQNVGTVAFLRSYAGPVQVHILVIESSMPAWCLKQCVCPLTLYFTMYGVVACH